MNHDLAQEAWRLAWIPPVTAFIGWITNWLAIQMLFRPRRPWRLLGLRVQGLIPRRQAEVADRVAEIVEREFLSQHLIREQLHQLDVHGYVDHFVRRLVRERLGAKLRGIPLIGQFVNDSTLAMLERLALESVHEEIEPLRNRLADDIEARLQVRDIVRARIAEFEMEQLESVVRRVAARELRLIEWLGGAVGLAVGLGQMAVLLAMR